MASKKHRDKVARHGGYNLLRNNAHLQRKKNKVKLKKLEVKDDNEIDPSKDE
jgi:hypothetical protein